MLVPGLVNIQKANWNMAIEIVDFPINSMVDLSIAMLVHQRVHLPRFPKSYIILLLSREWDDWDDC